MYITLKLVHVVLVVSMEFSASCLVDSFTYKAQIIDLCNAICTSLELPQTHALPLFLLPVPTLCLPGSCLVSHLATLINCPCTLQLVTCILHSPKPPHASATSACAASLRSGSKCGTAIRTAAGLALLQPDSRAWRTAARPLIRSPRPLQATTRDATSAVACAQTALQLTRPGIL